MVCCRSCTRTGTNLCCILAISALFVAKKVQYVPPSMLYNAKGNDLVLGAVTWDEAYDNTTVICDWSKSGALTWSFVGPPAFDPWHMSIGIQYQSS